MKNKLFLDLEDTIITPVVEGWHNTELINIEKINKFISENEIESISLFSFAVWNQEELALFKQHTLPLIEDAIGQKIWRMPTVDDDIIPSCCTQKGVHPSRVDFSEMSNFWSKDLAFILCMKEWFKKSRDIRCILLDDMVEDQALHFPRNNLHLTLLNIDNM